MGSVSSYVLFFGLNYLNDINQSLYKKKTFLYRQLSILNSKIRITNCMLVTSMYDDLDFKVILGLQIIQLK